MFNGFYVTYFCNDRKTTKTDKYETLDAVIATCSDFSEHGNEPDAETFATNCYLVFGDIVRDVQDKDGNVLFDNTKQYDDEVEEFNNFY